MARISGRLAWWSSPNGVRALLVLVILLSFGLRLYRLGYRSIWYDEAVSIHLATKDLRGLTLHTAGDIHPPLYYYVLHFWIVAAGASEFSSAFLSLFFGVLIVALAYRLASDLYDKQIGLLTAFLIAISPFNLWYSQEIRMYTLGAFLGVISLYCLVRLAGMTRLTSSRPLGQVETSSDGDQAKLRFWIGYILSAAAGLYTLYYFAFLLLFENFFVVGWWLFNRAKERKAPLSLARWLLAQAAVLALCLPWLPIALRQMLDPPVPPWRGLVGLGTVLVESWTALALGQSVDPWSVLVWPLLSFLFAIYLLGLLSPSGGGRGRVGTALLGGYTFVPLLMIYLLSLRTPLFHARYVFTYSPPFYLVLALGLVSLRARWRFSLPIALSILTVACGYSIYNFHFAPEYASDDHRGAVSYTEERIGPGDAVLINAGYAYPPFLYYYGADIAWRGRLVDYEPGREVPEGIVLLQTGVIGGDKGLGWGDPASDFYATTQEETAQALERVFAHHPRVWVYRIYDTVADPQGFIRDWLDEHGRMIGDVEFAGPSYMRVQCYATDPGPEYGSEPSYHPVDLTFGGQITLLGYEGPGGVRSGDDLALILFWQAEREMEREYETHLRLRTSDGMGFAHVVAPPSPSTTEWYVGEIVSQTLSTEIPVGTPPLVYDLVIEMRDSDSGEAMAGQDGDGTIGTTVVDRALVPPRPPRMAHEPWANFGDALQLVGYELDASEAELGDEIGVEILWRAWDVPLPLVEAVVELRDEEGRVQAIERGGCLDLGYPTTLWGREELVRDVYRLQIPPDAAPGSYEVTLTLQRILPTGLRETVPLWSSLGEWEESFPLGTVDVIAP